VASVAPIVARHPESHAVLPTAPVPKLVDHHHRAAAFVDGELAPGHLVGWGFAVVALGFRVSPHDASRPLCVAARTCLVTGAVDLHAPATFDDAVSQARIRNVILCFPYTSLDRRRVPASNRHHLAVCTGHGKHDDQTDPRAEESQAFLRNLAEGPGRVHDAIITGRPNTSYPRRRSVERSGVLVAQKLRMPHLRHVGGSARSEHPQVPLAAPPACRRAAGNVRYSYSSPRRIWNDSASISHSPPAPYTWAHLALGEMTTCQLVPASPSSTQTV